MNMRKLDIGVDIDGVLYPLVDELRKYAIKTGLEGDFPTPTCWDFAPEWGMSENEFLDLLTDAATRGTLLETGPAYPGSAQALGQLLDIGHRVHLVTDRGWLGQAGKSRTLSWLKAEGIRYSSLTLTKDKTSVPCDVFIDDRPENYQALVEAGVDAYLRDHLYNKHIRTPRGRRVGGMLTFAAAITSL